MKSPFLQPSERNVLYGRNNNPPSKKDTQIKDYTKHGDETTQAVRIAIATKFRHHNHHAQRANTKAIRPPSEERQKKEQYSAKHQIYIQENQTPPVCLHLDIILQQDKEEEYRFDHIFYTETMFCCY